MGLREGAAVAPRVRVFGFACARVFGCARVRASGGGAAYQFPLLFDVGVILLLQLEEFVETSSVAVVVDLGREGALFHLQLIVLFLLERQLAVSVFRRPLVIAGPGLRILLLRQGAWTELAQESLARQCVASILQYPKMRCARGLLRVQIFADVREIDHVKVCVELFADGNDIRFGGCNSRLVDRGLDFDVLAVVVAAEAVS